MLCGFKLYDFWYHRLFFRMSLSDTVGLVTLEWRRLYLIQKIFCSHILQVLPIRWRNISNKILCRHLWLSVYLFVQIQFQDGLQHLFVFFLGIELHLEWLWQCCCHIIWICSELAIDVGVVQYQFIFQWNLQWRHFFGVVLCFCWYLGFWWNWFQPHSWSGLIFHPCSL